MQGMRFRVQVTHEEFFKSLPQDDQKVKKKRTRSEFEESDGEDASQEAIRDMAKHIRLLEDETKLMSQTQLKMQQDMESLIKKTVMKVSKHVIKATKKTTQAME